MPKRRNVLIGMGALAVGSGATALQAAFNQQTGTGADFRIIAAADLRVQAGPAFDGGASNYTAYTPDDDGEDIIDGGETGGINWDNLVPGDLPLAWANTNDNDDLIVELGRRNNASELIFDELVEITNEGTTEEDVGIAFSNGAGEDGMSPAVSESWFNNDSYSLSDTDNITRGDVQEIFQYNETGVGNDTRISPDPTAGVEGPDQTYPLAPGDSLVLDVVTDLRGDSQQSVFASNSGGGSPFSEGSGVDFRLLDTVYVGTGWSE